MAWNEAVVAFEPGFDKLSPADKAVFREMVRISLGLHRAKAAF
jgi:hypothetical protein